MEKEKFNPSEHLETIKGKPYLPVAWRIVWFRSDHPDWSIETEVKQTEDKAFAKATIKDSTGRIIATAHKAEDIKGFFDFAEKAETGSIGRALALCGYGTQFSPEIEEGVTRIVDSPVTTIKPEVRSTPILKEEKVVSKPASDTIRKMYFAVAKSAGYESEKAKQVAKDAYKVDSFNNLTHDQLQKLVTAIAKRKKKVEEIPEEDFDGIYDQITGEEIH